MGTGYENTKLNKKDKKILSNFDDYYTACSILPY